MKRTSENIKNLIQQELLNIANHIVKKGLKSLLVSEPISHMREWDYGKENEKALQTFPSNNSTTISLLFDGKLFWPTV